MKINKLATAAVLAATLSASVCAGLPSGGVTQASSPVSGTPFGTGQIYCTSTTDTWHTKWSIKNSNLWHDCLSSGNPGQFNVNQYTVTFKADAGCTPPPDAVVTVTNGKRATLTIIYK